MARQDDYIRTALRLPPELHKALHESADASGKSFNSEIIARLQASFRQEEAEAPPYAVPAGVNPELDRQIAAMHKRIASIADALEGVGLLPKPSKSDAKQT